MVWVLEQPRESLLRRHRRFEWLCNLVSYVTRSLLGAQSETRILMMQSLVPTLEKTPETHCKLIFMFDFSYIGGMELDMIY